ncbi:MAG: Ig-like domain-containing protein, partial [Gemmatimonadales bacterium]
MPLLTSLRLRLLLVGGFGTAAADPGTPLRVLRSAPSQNASPTATITVTFDRPVAGSLDRTVDPRQILTVEPAVAGRAEWRDPVTIRLRPAVPLTPNTTYRVTVTDRFEAMDGSRLDGPYRFAFRVRGPRVLAGIPVGPDRQARFLTPAPVFELVFDAPPDPGVLARAVYLELDQRCASSGGVRLRAESQRAVTEQDRWEFRDAGGWDRDRSADSLRRVVRLLPERELPRGCGGHLVAPASLDDRGRDSLQRWPFSTFGNFRLTAAACGWSREHCPTGPLTVTFTTPVRGAEVQRHLRLTPAVPFTVSDTAEERDQWPLQGELAPRTWYGVVADTGLRDVFGQRLTGNPVATARTSGYAPAVNYAWGRAVVERKGPRTLAVTHVNVDTLEVLVAPVPDSLERELMSRSEWQWSELWPALLPGARRRRIAVAGSSDRVGIYGVPLPEPAAGTRAPTLLAVQVTSPRLDSMSRRNRPIALVQVTDLGAHARVGVTEGAVWVTGASDGLPRPGATVTLHDPGGAVLAAAKSGADGVARFPSIRTPPAKADEGENYSRPEGYITVALGGDRTLVPLNRYDPDLSPWRFNVSAAWGSERLPVAAAVFTERGIYRPGERVYAKSIVRTGLLGNLVVPAGGDSLRWVFYDRSGEDAERGRLQEKTVALSAFGTAQSSLVVPAAAGLGTYEVAVELRRKSKWIEVASTSYRVAEYRPPEFLVDVAADSGARFAGDSIRTTVEARYLFGAPMGRAAVSWTLRQQSDGGGPSIPGYDDYLIGDTGWWWEEMEGASTPVQVTASGTDTLDPRGRLALRLPLRGTQKGRTGFATFEATVKDVNRQTVSASAGVVVHPAAFYLGAKPSGEEYFWTAGTPVGVGVIAVRPDGRREHGVRVAGMVVRREWHQLHRERDGYGEVTGEWVSDTVARCALVTAAEPARCGFTPTAGGTYTVTFRATDGAGREAVTSFVRWATGKDWVPWNDASQFKMDVIPDRTRYTVGDTATVLFASPFTDAEAWITVEREGLLQQRRLRITSGSTTLRLPITETLAPNAFVSIVVARGRSAKPGRVDDPGRPTIRVGYTELRVTPEPKRLTVAVEPAQPEWRPGDTAQVSVSVSTSGRGVRSEVTLWAVDAGVLALTGYTTPDPIDLIYRPRGLGLRLASNLTSVAAQIPEGQKGKRAPGGGGGLDAADVLRSRFQTTAFFLGSVVTDSAGRAIARAKLPDNLTTFRLMAVAVTAGDRYGKGESSLLVTRPLVARPALPRFLRDGDRFAAGVVVNR